MTNLFEFDKFMYDTDSTADACADNFKMIALELYNRGSIQMLIVEPISYVMLQFSSYFGVLGYLTSQSFILFNTIYNGLTIDQNIEMAEASLQCWRTKSKGVGALADAEKTLGWEKFKNFYEMIRGMRTNKAGIMGFWISYVLLLLNFEMWFGYLHPF